MELSSIWSVILSMASESGVWAMLFLALLIVLIKSYNKRESIYQNVIKSLGKNLTVVSELKEDVEDIKFALGIGGNSQNFSSQKDEDQARADNNTNAEEQNESKTKSQDV